MSKPVDDIMAAGITSDKITAAEDALIIDGDNVACEKQEDGSLDVYAVADAIALLREAKEKHLPILITNHDESKCLIIKDANDLNGHISFNGIPFIEL